MLRVLALGIAVALSGCANWDAHQSTEAALYVGKPIDALYDEYGVPVGIAPTSDGGKFLEFEGRKRGYLCTAKVTADSHGIVTKIKTGGQNGCITPF